MVAGVPAEGWYATVEHPDTNRILHAEPLADPRIQPSVNSLPRINLPVPVASIWQELEGEPVFNVYKDGEQQPIDELTDTSKDFEGSASVLSGVGGTELREQVDVEYRQERRHEVAKDVINNYTSYTADVPDPTFDTQEDQTFQDVSTTAEFNSVIDIADTDPILTSGDEIKLAQVAYVQEGETAGNIVSDISYSGGDAHGIAGGNSTDYDYTGIEYTIPADNARVYYRVNAPGGTHDGYEVLLNGDSVGTTAQNALNEGVQWLSTGNPNSDIDGSAIVRFDTNNDSLDLLHIDVVAVVDDRYVPSDGNLDNTVHEDNGYLNDPQEKPENYELTFNQSDPTAFVITGGAATATYDDTTADQRMQISNDNGSNWYPDDGTEDNTSSVTVDPFPDVGTTLRFRTRLSRISPNGARDQTPRFGYDSQTLSDFELTGDIRLESLIIDQRFEQSVADTLSDVAGEDFLWSFEDGTVTFIQPGTRTGDDPDLIAANVQKQLERIWKFTVHGSNRDITNEQFTASLTFQELLLDDIVTGSESVTDSSGTAYERGTDYEMDYSDGEIRAVNGGGLSTGSTYRIDYSAETKGSYTDPSAPASPRSETVEVPAAVSDRQCEQLAYVLVDEFAETRYRAEITVPPDVAEFAPVESLPLSDIGLPSDAGPFEIVQSPEVSPEGTRFELGTRDTLSRTLSNLNEQVRQTSRRV